MEATGELAWFRGEIWRSLIHPRDFARGLAREHYGLAGVVVALVAGVGLSVGIDLIVLASKGIAPTGFLSRMAIDAVFLGIRLAVSAAAVAWVASGAVRALGRRAGTLDQLFTALTFATAPLLLVPIAGLVVTAAAMTETLTEQIAGVTVLVLAAVFVLALALRVVIGLALNIRGILPPVIAVVTFVIVVTLGGFVLGDQISRMRFLAYSVVPQLVTDFPATPATGTRYEMLGFDLTVPEGWKIASTGVQGEAGRFESATATIFVQRARGAALSTADTYADIVANPQRVGLQNGYLDRSVTRINGVVMVDDRYGGTYEGRRILLRQFTAVPSAQGLALVYRVVEPADERASLDEAAAIAATWHITAQGR